MLGQLDTFVAFAVVILAVSLLITVLNQTMVALLAMRTNNLRWALRTLLQQVDPRLENHADTIASQVIAHPLITDSAMSGVTKWPLIGWLMAPWCSAKAVRVEELGRILRRLSKAPATGDKAEPAPPWRQLLETALADDDAKAKRRARDAAKALNALAPAAQGQLDKVAPRVVAQLQKATGDLELWFDAVMDRATQRFAVRMRAWTVVWAVIIAFALHLDASQLFRQIQDNPQLRAKLLESAGAFTQQAEELEKLAATSVVGDAFTRLQESETDLKALKPPADVASLDTALAWLDQQGLAPERKTELAARLKANVTEEAKRRLGELTARAGTIRTELQNAGLQILPSHDVHWPSGRSDLFPFYSGAEDRSATPPRLPGLNQHFLGVLFSAMLLSLGAPFWFNVLKSAATLRPVIGTQEKEERGKRA